MIWECPHCGEPVRPGEAPDLMPNMCNFHRECALRIGVGSAAHQLQECTCYGGDREDPPGMTPRQAARLAAEVFATLRKKAND